MTPDLDPSPREGQRGLGYLMLVILVATVGGFLFGFDTMIWTGAQLSLEKHFNLSEAALGFAASSVMIGALSGTFSAAIVSDFMGRKKTMMMAAVLFMLSAIGTALPHSIVVFDVFRTLGGIGIGLAMVISPVYIAEISPRHIRGRLVTFNQIIIVFGSIVAMGLDTYVTYKVRDDNLTWRILFGAECVPIVVFIIGLFSFREARAIWLRRTAKTRPSGF